MLPLLKDKYKEEYNYLVRVCRELGGDVIPDEDENDVTCMIPDAGLSITYSAKNGSYIVSFYNDEVVLSVLTRDRPDIYTSYGTFSMELQKPEYVRVFNTPKISHRQGINRSDM